VAEEEEAEAVADPLDLPDGKKGGGNGGGAAATASMAIANTGLVFSPPSNIRRQGTPRTTVMLGRIVEVPFRTARHLVSHANLHHPTHLSRPGFQHAAPASDSRRSPEARQGFRIGVSILSTSSSIPIITTPKRPDRPPARTTPRSG